MSDVQSGQAGQGGETGWRPSPKQVVGAVVLVLAVVFALMNTDKHDVNVFGFWHPSTYTWLWMLILLVVGVLIGLVLPFGRKKD